MHEWNASIYFDGPIDNVALFEVGYILDELLKNKLF